MRILLIAGHGAGDPGAAGYARRDTEANCTRELVGLIAPKLRQYATVDVYNTSRNAYADVQAGRFNIGSYNYVLEVHFNAFNNGSAKGTEIWVTDQEKAVDVENQIMSKMGQFFTVRGVKRANFSVITSVKNHGISSALIETCFIDNKNDFETYKAKKDAIAQAIVNGIAEGFKLKKATPAPKPVPSTPSNTPDQILSIDSKVKFESRLKVDGIRGDDIHCNTVSPDPKAYLPAGPLNETTAADGKKDQILHIGAEFTYPGTYTVDKLSKDQYGQWIVRLKELNCYVRPSCLIEVAEGR